MTEKMFVTTLAGVRMPRIIYGTAWKKAKTKDYVIKAIHAGFRGIDTACQPRHYKEHLVGEAVEQAIREKIISRNEIFLQTKFTPVTGQDANSIPYNPRDPLPKQVQTSVEKSLSNLQTDYIDSLLIHSPLGPNEGGMNGTLTVWRTLESFVKSGKIKQIGISNLYSLPVLKELWEFAEIKPSVIQNRFFYDTGYDYEIREFCLHNHIFYQSFWTLTANPHILASHLIKSIAKFHGKTPEQIFFRFLMKKGIVPLSGTTNEQHMLEDVEVSKLVFDLSSEEVEKIESLLSQ